MIQHKSVDRDQESEPVVSSAWCFRRCRAFYVWLLESFPGEDRAMVFLVVVFFFFQFLCVLLRVASAAFAGYC